MSSNVNKIDFYTLRTIIHCTDNFVVKATAKFDESHNHVHARKVCDLAMNIVENTSGVTDEMAKVIVLAALLHDVMDPKYSAAEYGQIKRADLFAFINSQIPGDQEGLDAVVDIIDNISYSKQVKGETRTLEEPWETCRKIVSDADKITAIGFDGVRRAYEYRRTGHEGADPAARQAEIIQHCHDKLLRLYRDGFICTARGREIAAPLHAELEEFVMNPAVIKFHNPVSLYEAHYK